MNIRTFDLNLIRVFEALNHDRSVSAAAAKLCLSQPAVSNALNRLRREFDDPLFIRTRNGMQPTPKADQLALTLNEGMTAIRAGLSASAAFDPSSSDREFTLLMTDVGQVTFLPVVLSAINRKGYSVRLKVLDAELEHYEELIENGSADLAIGRIKLSDSFCSEFIHSSPFVVIASRHNRFISFSEGGEPFISMENYLCAPHIVDSRRFLVDPIRQALGAKFNQRRVAVSVSQGMVMPAIMEGTDLVATVPKVCASRLTATCELCVMPTPFAIEQNFVYQWWHKRNSSDAGSKWLRQTFATAGV